MSSKYTDKQKIAYYKRKAASGSSAKKPYRKKSTYKRKAAAPRRRTDGVIGSAIGGAIGTAVGGAPGGLLGAAIGKGVNQLFTHITGFGDYRVQQNSLMHEGMSVPQVVNSMNRGGFIVRHREYLGDIDATTAFTVHSYPINPGMNTTFPWLSQIANSFEEYRMRGLVFEFKSLSSDAVLSSATSSALGSVIMATAYDVLDPTFATKMEMENYEFANSSKPSCSFVHLVECKKSLTAVSELYIRDSDPPSNSDQRLYDLGMFQIATVGMQANSGVAGELWCTYEVELYHPKFDTATNLEAATDHFLLGGTVSGTHPLGTAAATVTANSNIGGTLDYAGHRYTFPAHVLAGTMFLFSYNLYQSPGSSYAVVCPTLAHSNCTIFNGFDGGGYSVLSSPGDGSSTFKFNMTFIVEITTTSEIADTYIQWNTDGTVNADVVGYQDLLVTVINPDYHG
jgi:hypothetical protein